MKEIRNYISDVITGQIYVEGMGNYVIDCNKDDNNNGTDNDGNNGHVLTVSLISLIIIMFINWFI